MLRYLTAVCLCLLLAQTATGQIPRERAAQDMPLEDVFWSSKVILTNSVYSLPARNLNVTIMHSFGIATGGVTTLFGMDDSANIRFGVDYGITDRLSVGLGRSRFDKLYDGRFKAKLLRQSEDDRIPLEAALTGTLGIATLENGMGFDDRLNYFASAIVARQLSEHFTLQLSPMLSHFNAVLVEQDDAGQDLEPENTHFALGVAAQVVLNERFALLLEFLPILGPRSDGTANAFSVGVDIDTGGHVFQLFLTTSQWLTEQHVLARNTDSFFEGDFRIGFNVNRVFGL